MFDSFFSFSLAATAKGHDDARTLSLRARRSCEIENAGLEEFSFSARLELLSAVNGVDGTLNRQRRW